MKFFLTATFLFLFAANILAQSAKLSGSVVDAKTRQPLIGAIVTATSEGNQPKGETTDADGKFSFSVKYGTYAFKVSFLGYTSYQKELNVSADMQLGIIRLQTENKQIDEVKAVGVMKRQEQRGDTTIFNAEAFKVNPDATTEDLIKKMPGMQVNGNSVTSGGETVKKVLVDGKEYFGDDPMTALRNIQADMVSKIEVYDKQSDQSQFTGFSDGNEEKTINILTKMGIQSGYFGKLYAGYGTNDRYEAGGTVNYFNNEHRLSVIGLLNNVNQQNFSFSDITGAMGGSSSGRSGKNVTGSIGLNHTFEREKKIKTESSYFYNYNKNKNSTLNTQEYFQTSDKDSLHIYNSTESSEGKNYDHRATLRLTWTIDDKNSIIFTPRLNWQDNDKTTDKSGSDLYNDAIYRSVEQGSTSSTQGFSGNGNLMWRHKFDLSRRTFSINVGSRISLKDVNKDSYNNNLYTYSATRSYNTTQQADEESNSVAISMSAMYTEPVGSIMALQVNYSPTYTHSKGDRYVEADTVQAGQTADSNYAFSPLLSSKKTSDYWQHKGGIGLNIFKDRTFNATIGLDLQYAKLEGEQEYPISSEVDKEYVSLLPSLMVRFRKSRTMNLRLNYRTATNAPSISQLQKVVDVSDTRKYSGGNENLNQSYTHSLRMMYALNNPETSRGVFFMFDYSTTRNYIGTSSVIASSDSTIDLNIVLPAGTQYDKPININGYWSARSNVTLSSPVSWLGSNVNLNLGANMTREPGLYNGKKVKSDTYNLSGGLTIGSSFSENIDFTLSYNCGYNIVKSETVASRNYNYYNHSASCNLTYLFLTRFSLTNNLAHQLTQGMGAGFDQSYLNWNASLGVKFFKDRRAELRLRVNDILDNTQSVSRKIQTTYVQTTQSDVLRRYAMLTFTYNIKPKNQQTIKQWEEGEHRRMGPPDGGGMGGGMPRGGGGPH